MKDKCPETIVKFNYYHCACYGEHVATVKDQIDPTERNLATIIAILKREKEKDPSIAGIRYTLKFHIDSQSNNADPDRYFSMEENYFHDIFNVSYFYDLDLPKFIDDMLTEIHKSNKDDMKHIPIDSKQKELMYPRMKALAMAGYVRNIEITGNYYDSEFYEKTFSNQITTKEYYERRRIIHELRKEIRKT